MAKRAKSRASSRKCHDRTKKAISLSRANSITRQGTDAGQQHLELQAQTAGTPQGVNQLSQNHTQILGTFTYADISRAVVAPETLRAGCGLDPDEFLAALSHVIPEFVEQMKPRDALEKLALEQLMVQHARVLSLSRQAAASTELDIVKVLNEACDGASSSFRRLMTSFRDHRRPKNTGAGFNQTNLANQQIIQNLQIPENTQNGNEQTKISQLSEAAVPPQPERLGITAGFDPEPASMGSEHRPSDFGRQGSRQPQRTKARRALGRKDRS